MSRENSRTRTRVKERNRKEELTNNTETETTDSQSESTVCPECSGSVVIDEKRGESACEDCGLVVDDANIDRGPEWRAFDSKERDEKSRVGAPSSELLHDKGLSTNIDWRDKDSHGSALSSRKRQQMKRLRKWNERSKATDSKERNLRHALGEITRMASALGLPKDIQKIASMIYRQCLERDMLPGRSIEGMATASLYAASRQGDVPRTLDEMEQVSRIGKKETGRAYRYIDRELELGIGPSDPEKYIPRFIAELDGVSDETERLARQITQKVKNKGLHSGKTPPGIAAASIYFAGKLCNEEPTQDALSDVTGVTEVTIRERYLDIIQNGNEEWIHG
jgi:transcription initiation factor TFIIB